MPEVCKLPKTFRDTRGLQRALVARRLLFGKINIMPKGQSTILKDALCHIPINLVDVCNALQRPADSNGIVLVKRKRNLQYRGHFYFEFVRLNLI